MKRLLILPLLLIALLIIACKSKTEPFLGTWVYFNEDSRGNDTLWIENAGENLIIIDHTPSIDRKGNIQYSEEKYTGKVVDNMLEINMTITIKAALQNDKLITMGKEYEKINP